NLLDLEAGQAGIDRELEVEFHTRTHRADALVGRSGKGAEAAIDVGVASSKQPVEDSGQRGIADEAVQPGHVLVAALEVPAAGDEVVALALEGVQESGNQRKVVGIVGIAHDEVGAARRGEALEV